MFRKWRGRACLAALTLVLAMVVAGVGVAWLQGRHTPQGRPEYVALGSSFAAGAGLGALEQGSPLLCARSVNGYPQQLARMRRLALIDMSCGGAVTRHLLRGGQVFQGPQIRVIDPRTRLVTLTAGGNDIGYVGDLSLLAARNSDTVFGWLVRTLWKGPKAQGERDYAGLEAQLTETLRAVRAQAPDAVVVVATYPTLLPSAGTCARIGLTQAEADQMRQVGDQLAATTRAAAKTGGAILVDMHVLGAAHDPCSASPWTNGWIEVKGGAFHPTLAGAEATAQAISAALDAAQASATR